MAKVTVVQKFFCKRSVGKKYPREPHVFTNDLELIRKGCVLTSSAHVSALIKLFFLKKALSKLRTAMANKLWAGLKWAHSCTSVWCQSERSTVWKYLTSTGSSLCRLTVWEQVPCFQLQGLACQCDAGISSASHGEFSSVGNGFIMASHTEQNSCQPRALTLHTIQINLLWAAPQGLDCVFKWRHFKNRLKETRVAELQWFQFAPTNLSPAGNIVPEFVVAAAALWVSPSHWPC